MTYLKQVTLLICLPIFFIPQLSNAMDLIVPTEKPNDRKQETLQEIKQPHSLKQYCFNGLLKEENKEKVALKLEKTVLPTELMQEFTNEVVQKGSVGYIAHIAHTIPQIVYPDIGLELLCSRSDDKKQRKEILEILLKRTHDNELVTSLLQDMNFCFDTIIDEHKYIKKYNATKEELFIIATTHVLVRETFLNFLLSRNITPNKSTLETYLNNFEFKESEIIRKYHKAMKTNSVFFDNVQEKFFKKKFLHLSHDDAQLLFALHNSYNTAYKNVQKLLKAGFRPNPRGFQYYNNDFIYKERLLEHFLEKLTLLLDRDESDLDNEYEYMARDGLLNLELNENAREIRLNMNKFYQDKPEHRTISYLKTELKDHPFTQKMPLFEQMIMQTTEFYRNLLCLLMPYCKNELQQHHVKKNLENAFQMPLEELEKLCDDQKK